MKRLTLISLLLTASLATQAQTTPGADVQLNFSITAEGHRFSPTWGLDQAWINEQNVLKGINHMGADNIGVGRSAFRTTKALLNDSVLKTDQIDALKTRNTVFNKLSNTLPLILTADQAAGTDEYFVVNKSANVSHWAACINSHVDWLQTNTKHPVLAVSPFNEPDYWTVEEGATIEKHAQVAQLLKQQYPRFADIDIVGGNTLNNDKAWAWFSGGSDYYNWGNTHQLAGSFDNYVLFYQRLAELGRVGYNDEMHNVAEAMIGLEYGMTVGVWWGFDSRARGEFCDISRHGTRLAYGEHRPNWTSACVYRHDDGRVKAFLGTSERQAYTTTWRLVSTDRPVYFDGYGPQYVYTMEMPGGTGYQRGQTNAERVVDITWGPDVQPCPITEGVYKIVNKATGNVLAINNGTIVMQQWQATSLMQQWMVKPCSSRVGGDFSFFEIESMNNRHVRINVKDFSTKNNADLLAYEQTTSTSNEQWYLEYAGNGYYYIRNRESAMYMAAYRNDPYDNVAVKQTSLQTGNNQSKILWRLLPLDIDYETKAPASPQNVGCTPLSASILLTWDAVEADDLDGYMVLRAIDGTDDWNVIGRMVKQNSFVDNNCRPATSYIYKVRAIDKAQNLSGMSDEVRCQASNRPALVAQWTMEDQTVDVSENGYDGTSSHANLFYVDDCKEGGRALRFIGSLDHHVQLPAGIASTPELTVTMWVNLRSNSIWQRLFDFGIDKDHYLFLTANSGNGLRFGIKNGGSEQFLDGPSLALQKWYHVAVTIGKQRVVIYLDGQPVAQTDGITITPADISPVLNYLGRSQFASDPYFTGYLDDVRIFNYALSESQVQTSMAGEVDGVPMVSADNHYPSGPTTRYTLDGKQVNSRSQHPAIHINRYSDGSVRKAVR